jgi:hypothetical protein
MLLTYLWFQQFQINLCSDAGSNIVSASRECDLDGVLIVNGPTRSTHTMIQGSDSAILGEAAHIYYAPSTSLSFDILDKKNINNQ